MSDEILVVLPREVSAGTIHAVVGLLPDEDNANHQLDAMITFDLRETTYVDVEGANYIALLPTMFASQGWKIRVYLPRRSSTREFLTHLGVTRYLAAAFETTGAPALERTAALSRRGAALPQLLGGARSFVVRGGAARAPRGALTAAEVVALAEGLPPGAAATVTRCALELLYNVFEHSGEDAAAVTFHLRRDGPPIRSHHGRRGTKLFVAVTDVGCGIRKSLSIRFCREFGKPPSSDAECLEYALTPGVTRRESGIGGLGLHTVATHAERLRLFSGSALVITGRAESGTRRHRQVPFLPGTSAHIEVPIGE